MFELNVESNTPLTPLKDVDDIALQFLTHIGYLPKGYNPKTNVVDTQESVPYRLFMDCFMRNIKRAWQVEELAAYLGTTKPTIYRHLNKLKAIDILEEVEVERDGGTKRGYRIRYGDLRKAWSFTEANVEMAMENYRQTVDHLQKLIEESSR
ncbi:MAG TPA: helix-turn-helix transcriptional regulator [Euryarchaeota archaeon]|jgi:predicted transcriptional regulator|nr:helix-turn-helix transcriptional regulator [Euryarchaeota archaeon]